MTVVDRFKAEYNARQAYDTESKYFNQEHIKDKAWIGENETVMLVHKSVSNVGVMDIDDCNTPPASIEAAKVPDHVDTMVTSGETLYELSVDGTTHVLAERYCEIVADLFNYELGAVLENARLDTSKYEFPVRIVGPNEYDAVIAPYVGDIE
jgi:hypothetical protein